MSEPLIMILKRKVEELTPFILWEGNTNNVEEITLKNAISNYTKLKIFYKDNDGQRNSIEIDNSDKSNEIPVSLSSFYNSGEWFNVKMRSIQLSDNKIKGIGQANYEFSSKEILYNNNIFITKIEGYK